MTEVVDHAGAAKGGMTKQPRNGARSSSRMVTAMELIMTGTNPYQAAKQAKVRTSTIYRSGLYKLWKRGELAQLHTILAKKREKLPQSAETVTL